jgi:high affinity cGMP-specific 3',5'-cyclic phosphodiesterase 9
MENQYQLLTNAFNKVVGSFSFQDQDHRAQLLCILIKCADISTEVRPPEIAGIFTNHVDVWVNRLLEEFFSQSDREKQEGLPFLPFMDRLKVTKAGAQTGYCIFYSRFLGFCVIPLYEALSKLYPTIESDFLVPIRKALEFYKALEKK